MGRRLIPTEVPISGVVMVGIIVVSIIFRLEELIGYAVSVSPAHLICETCSRLSIDLLLRFEGFRS
jgi:hypothetical protein